MIMKIRISLLVCGLMYSIVSFISSADELEAVDMLVISNLDTKNVTSFSLINNNQNFENIILKPREQCYVNEGKILPKASRGHTTIKLADGAEVFIKKGTNSKRKIYPNQLAMANSQARFYIQQENLNSWMPVTDSQVKPRGVGFIPRHVVNEGKSVGYLLGISPSGKTEAEINAQSVKDSYIRPIFSCEDKAGGFEYSQG